MSRANISNLKISRVVYRERMPVSDAQKSSQSKYYEKNAEAIKTRMREYAKKRRAQGVDTEMRSVYYYNTLDNKKRELIKRYKEDEGICPVFKEFLKECVEPHLSRLPLRFFAEFDSLAIVSPS